MARPLPAVRVYGEGARSLKRGSLLVYRKWVRGRREAGDLVVVEDERGDVLGCALYDTVGPVALRVVELGGCSYSTAEEAIRDRVEKAYALRRRLGLVGPGKGYRLVHSDGDLLPGLIVDVYDSLAVYQSSSIVWDRLAEILVNSLVEVLGPETTVYEKSVQRTRRDIGLEPREALRRRGRTGLRVVIEEGAARFLVDPRIGQKTGFFLDQRLNRIEAERLVEDGSTVLDLFSYTGGFGIHALLAGARQAVFVEVDEKAVKLLRENLRLNRVEERAHVVNENAWTYLRKPGTPFNAVFVDPPAFIQAEKDYEKGFNAYRRLYRRAVQLLKPPALVFLSSCSTFLRVSDFRQLVSEALEGRDYRLVGDVRGAPPDHPGRLLDPHLTYLKAVYVEVYG